MIQHFKLYAGEHVYDIDDNISFMPLQQLTERMHQYVAQFGLDVHGRYVAMGNAGDCVIYDNGNIDQMSDSG
jgi:hypothetical protein